MEVRSLMRSLEAGEMSWDDVVDEIRRHGQTALQPHGIEFSLTVKGEADDSGPGVYAGLSLLRLLKEAFSNAVKHAACSRVAVEAEFTPDRLRLTVRDNGRGLPPQRPATGRGLRNMAARIEEIGGAMSHRSADGLELVFTLPLPIQYTDPAAGSTPAAIPAARPAAPAPAPRRSALARLSRGLFQ
jgi:signal transduction histidine kinase